MKASQTAMLPSWLSFAIFDTSSNSSSSGSAASSPRSAVVHDVTDVVKGGVKHNRSVTKPSIPKHHEGLEDTGSVSAATSPMSNYAGTPKQDLDSSSTSHQRAPPSQLPGSDSTSNTAFSTPSRRRRSSVFFKLPDLDKINNLTSPGRNRSGNSNQSNPTTPVSGRDNQNSAQNAPQQPRSRRLSRASFSRSPRHRRAPIVPESKVIAQAAREANPVAPIRAVVNDIVTSSLSPGRRPPVSVSTNDYGDDPSGEQARSRTNRGGDAAAELTIDTGNAEVASQSEDWRSTPRGGLLRGWGDAGRGRRQTTAALAAAPEEVAQPTAAAAAAEASPEGNGRRPRSPRALSEGHR